MFSVSLEKQSWRAYTCLVAGSSLRPERESGIGWPLLLGLKLCPSVHVQVKLGEVVRTEHIGHDNYRV